MKNSPSQVNHPLRRVCTRPSRSLGASPRTEPLTRFDVAERAGERRTAAGFRASEVVIT
jgi:hypothetical protein